ncbi:ankyrin, partial [Thermothelomyces heterothallicus CBS 203.75]
TGRTALELAASKGHTEVVRALLERGADVTARTELGETPLWSAAHNGHAAAAELLLQHRADPN